MAYPASLDELTDGVPSDGAAPTTDLGDATFPHDDHHRALAVAVEAVEAELGTDPSGASATVAARFTATETVANAALPAATAASTYQPLDADLTAVAALTSPATTISNAVLKTTVDAKGDLLVGTADDTVARKAAGTNGYVLVAQSGASDGLTWQAQSGLVVNTVAAAGTTETLDGDDFNIHDITLDESVTFTFSTSAAVAQFTLILRQDGSGGNSVTWPASVKWHSATAPTILTSASAVHVLEFLTVDTGTTWRGFLASSAAS